MCELPTHIFIFFIRFLLLKIKTSILDLLINTLFDNIHDFIISMHFSTSNIVLLVSALSDFNEMYSSESSAKVSIDGK